jgi:NAD(P)H-hydrate repair Nnr-like enzyme with NAD(P)H-hydrate dehydratase domain
MKIFQSVGITLIEAVDLVFKRCFFDVVPPLTSSVYKGMMGRIGVIGGSKDYTGAPFYAAEGALKFGSDLSFVYTSTSAAIPIKCYSPELMVTPFYDDTRLDDLGTISTEVSFPFLHKERNLI